MRSSQQPYVGAHLTALVTLWIRFDDARLWPAVELERLFATPKFGRGSEDLQGRDSCR